MSARLIWVYPCGASHAAAAPPAAPARSGDRTMLASVVPISLGAAHRRVTTEWLATALSDAANCSLDQARAALLRAVPLLQDCILDDPATFMPVVARAAQALKVAPSSVQLVPAAPH